MSKRQQKLRHKVYRSAVSVHLKEVNDMLQGRASIQEGLVSLQGKLESVQEKLAAERAKANPNPVIIERCVTVIERLNAILANAAKTHVIVKQYAR